MLLLYVTANPSTPHRHPTPSLSTQKTRGISVTLVPLCGDTELGTEHFKRTNSLLSAQSGRSFLWYENETSSKCKGSELFSRAANSSRTAVPTARQRVELPPLGGQRFVRKLSMGNFSHKSSHLPPLRPIILRGADGRGQ